MHDIFEEIIAVKRERKAAALATVVGGEKGSPGKTGFRMLVYPDGKTSGTVGGGLLEAKVREEALRCIADKKPRLLELALDNESADSIGVLCGGQVKIFLEPVHGPSTVYVFGGGHIAVPLVQFAKTLDFTVVVVDDRQDFASRERFPQADEVTAGEFANLTKSMEFSEGDSVVIITHGHAHDEVVLKECLSKARLPGYIGMIGSRDKIARTFANLREQGISQELLAKVMAPIGLDIGARTPTEIALSIIAEIIADRYGKSSREKSLEVVHMKRTSKILFVCVENAGRSQMAEAFAKQRGISAMSAGTVPATTVNRVVVEVMKERRVDLSSSHPKMLTIEMVNEADLVVTMGCSVEEVCPAPLVARTQKKLLEWNIEDPKGKPIEEVRKIASQIENKVIGLLKND